MEFKQVNKMTNLKREDLMSLEEYAEKRAEFRAQVLELKKARNIALGEHATLYFENEQTIRYQIQELLRIEKVFEADGISEELEAYNPLISDGINWNVTFMTEHGVVEEYQKERVRLVGEDAKSRDQIGSV